MSIQIKANFTLAGVQEQLKRLETREIPFAMALIATRTAQASQAGIRQEMERVFDNPTPWILNSTYVKAAKKGDPNAVVYAKDSNGKSPSLALMAEVEGGQRPNKRSEGALKAAGYLPNGWQTAPGPGAKRDKYGNMSRGQMQQILAGLQASRHSSGRKGKGRPAEYFVVRPGDKNSLHPGVWQRKGASISLVLLFIQPPRYSERLDWYGVANRTAQAQLPSIAAVAVDDILSKSFGRGRGGR